jgi:hypothetical protein
MSNIHPIFESILEDFESCYAAGVDPNAFHVEHNGHRNFYTTHYCNICQVESPCKTQFCKQAFDLECLPCATRELLSDTERFSKEAREFLKTVLPTDDQTLMWWRALRAEIDGKLKGLAERSAEIAKRIDSGEKS